MALHFKWNCPDTVCITDENQRSNVVAYYKIITLVCEKVSRRLIDTGEASCVECNNTHCRMALNMESEENIDFS